MRTSRGQHEGETWRTPTSCRTGCRNRTWWPGQRHAGRRRTARRGAMPPEIGDACSRTVWARARPATDLLTAEVTGSPEEVPGTDATDAADQPTETASDSEPGVVTEGPDRGNRSPMPGRGRGADRSSEADFDAVDLTVGPTSTPWLIRAAVRSPVEQAPLRATRQARRPAPRRRLPRLIGQRQPQPAAVSEVLGDGAEVGLDGAFGDAQALGDLQVGQPFGH